MGYKRNKEQYEKADIKSSTKANSFKDTGNKYFQKKQYSKSIEFYTKSALYAPKDSTEYAVAFANRSAALFYLYRYRDCLQDINSALTLNYPQTLEYKLHLRAAKCHLELKEPDLAIKALSKAEDCIKYAKDVKGSAKALLEKQFTVLRILAITSLNSNNNTKVTDSLNKDGPPHIPAYGINPNFPYASIAVSRVHSLEKGRSVIANRFIKKGEILFVEKPVAGIPIRNDKVTCCYQCLRNYNDIPIPCNTCNDTFYCSMNCMKKAWSSHHQWECLGNNLDLWKNGGIGQIAFRVLMRSITELTDIDFNELQQLLTNMEKCSIYDRVYKAAMVGTILVYLTEYTDFFKVIDVEQIFLQKFSKLDPKFSWHRNWLNNKEVFISCLILRHTYQCITNAYTIENNGPKGTPAESAVTELSTIFLSISMMNHSCNPNTSPCFWNEYVVVSAAEDIPAGEEVLMCYGVHHADMPKEERQEALQKHYHFKCKCRACCPA